MLRWDEVDDDLQRALDDLGEVSLNAVCLAAALAVTGRDGPRSAAQVLALLKLVPARINELPADIREDERSDVLRMVDKAALGDDARLAEQALRPLADRAAVATPSAG